MSMSADDKEVFSKGRPYLVGLVALAFRLRRGLPYEALKPSSARCDFDEAEVFIQEFESRNGISNGKKK